MKGFIEVLANHVWGIICAVATFCGVPFFYNLIHDMDLNTDLARTLVVLVGVLVSGVSFALGWNQRNLSANREMVDATTEPNEQNEQTIATEGVELKRQLGIIQQLSPSEALALDLILSCEDKGKTYTTTRRSAALYNVGKIGIVVVTLQNTGPFDFRLERVYECATVFEWRKALNDSRGIIRDKADIARQESEKSRRIQQ